MIVHRYISNSVCLISDGLSRTMRCFTIFTYIVALVHTAPYVVLYYHYCRRTLAKVPRYSPFGPFFSPTHNGRCRRGPLPPPMSGRRPFQGNAHVPHIMGNDGCAWFVVIQAGGRGGNPVLLSGRFEGFLLQHNNQIARASTAAKGRGTPILAQRTRSPHHG